MLYSLIYKYTFSLQNAIIIVEDYIKTESLLKWWVATSSTIYWERQNE